MGYAHGTKWTEQSIKEGVLEVVKNCKLSRMPSRKEIEDYYNDCRLTNAISKRMGYYKLAQELGLPIKESNTYFGKKHEQILSEKLVCMGYEVERMPQNFPYDILVNNAIKIDAKVSRLYKGVHGNFYSFNLEKPYTTCDILVLMALDDNSNIKTFYVVPSLFVYKHTQIGIGENKSKYEKFKDKWSYLEQYISFIDEVS
jgi:hypothetical protein